MERTFYVLEKEGVKEQPSPDYVLCHVCEGRGILGYKIEDSLENTTIKSVVSSAGVGVGSSRIH